MSKAALFDMEDTLTDRAASIWVFALALDQLGVSSREAWFIGDHPMNDALGAASAGLTPVWLATALPWPADTTAPTHII